MKIYFCVLLSVLYLPNCYAWEGSHSFALNELKELVPFIRTSSQKMRNEAFRTYVLFPDKDISLTPNNVGAKAADYFRKQGIYSSQHLHRPEMLGHVFYMLTHDKEKALLWSVCISHALNDAASPHFVPSISFFINAQKVRELHNKNGQLISTMGLQPLSMTRANNSKEGRQIFEQFRMSYKYEPLAGDSQQIVQYLCTLPIYLRNASFKHGEYLRDNLQRNIFTENKSSHNGNLALAKMAVMGIRATADVLNLAWDFVQSARDLDVDALDKLKLQAMVNKLLKKRYLGQLPLYQGVLPVEAQGKIGLLCEEFFEVRNSCTGYSSRLLAASIMGTLKMAGIPFRALSLKNTLQKQLPTVDEMPILIVPAIVLNYRYRWMNKRQLVNILEDYSDTGGKILWISSQKATFLGELSYKINIHHEKQDFEKTEMMSNSLFFPSVLKMIHGTEDDEGRMHVNLLEMPFDDWPLQNKSQLQVSPQQDVIGEIISSQRQSGKIILGAYLKRSNGKKARHVCLSSAVMFPYMFSSELLDFEQPRLDKITAEILLKSLILLK